MTLERRGPIPLYYESLFGFHFVLKVCYVSMIGPVFGGIKYDTEPGYSHLKLQVQGLDFTGP